MLNNFFRKLHRLWDNVEKYGGDRWAINDVTIWRIRIACWISKVTCTYAHAHSHAPGHSHARTQRIHTQTNKQDLLLFHEKKKRFAKAPQSYGMAHCMFFALLFLWPQPLRHKELFCDSVAPRVLYGRVGYQMWILNIFRYKRVNW